MTLFFSSAVSPPLDAVTCGHCPAGFTGDGRTCTDIDECSVAGPDACHSSLTCVPTPPPHSDEDYRCHGVCPCGMRKVNGGKGEHGCVGESSVWNVLERLYTFLN